MPIDSYRFLDFATRQIIKAWVDREGRKTRAMPWAPMAKPLSQCTVALITTAGVARHDQAPFDQEERRNPWWGDPSQFLGNPVSARSIIWKVFEH
jgi:hypothetical protein